MAVEKQCPQGHMAAMVPARASVACDECGATMVTATKSAYDMAKEFATDPANVGKVMALLRELGGWSAGHRLFGPEVFKESDTMPMVAVFYRTHKSGNTHKSTIYEPGTGRRLDAVRGVHGLDVLRTLCGWYGVTFRTFFGRGSQAEEYDKVLRGHLARVENTAGVANAPHNMM